MTDSLLDNDIIAKPIAYGVGESLVVGNGLPVDRYSVLGTARFVLPKKIRKEKPRRGSNGALADLDWFLAQVATAEPSDDELEIAAQLDKHARMHELALDQGESQLVAMLVTRGLDYLLTGDKRAIRALESLSNSENDTELWQKVVCLEQLALWLVARNGTNGVRDAVCKHPNVDKGLEGCFACPTSGPVQEECIRGLSSYVEHLKEEAPNCLFPTVTP